jgi:hypothetical protein
VNLLRVSDDCVRLELTRRQLFERIWREPMVKLSREFGLSDRGLAKLCARHRIPVPGRGFWARVASGQNVKRTPLPSPDKGDQIVVIDGTGPPVAPEPSPPEVLAQIDFERRPENIINVSEDVVRYHPLVRAARESFAPRKQDYKRGLVSSGPGTLHIRVSPASKVRALRILDALVKACEIRGFEVRSSEVRASATSAQDAETIVKVNGEDVRLVFEEKCRSVEHVPTATERKDLARGSGSWIPKHDIVPTGLLSLQIDPFLSKTTWKDNAKSRLEACLNDVMVALVQTAILVVRPERLRQEAQQREWKERARREGIERHRREILKKALEEWRYAHSLDDFLAALRTAMMTAEIDPDGPSAQAEWLRWVCDYRECVDPFEELFEELEKPIPDWHWNR